MRQTALSACPPVFTARITSTARGLACIHAAAGIATLTVVCLDLGRRAIKPCATASIFLVHAPVQHCSLCCPHTTASAATLVVSATSSARTAAPKTVPHSNKLPPPTMPRTGPTNSVPLPPAATVTLAVTLAMSAPAVAVIVAVIEASTLLSPLSPLLCVQQQQREQQRHTCPQRVPCQGERGSGVAAQQQVGEEGGLAGQQEASGAEQTAVHKGTAQLLQEWTRREE